MEDCAIRSLLALLLLLAPATVASGAKRDDVPGYSFIQFTDNNVGDAIPRMSRNGLLVWHGQYQLPGATSGGSDYEIMLWDGQTLEQVTDDDVGQERAVVNERGEIAWMHGQESGTCNGEIFVRDVQGNVIQVTNDPVCSGIPGDHSLGDRYPEINAWGTVIWGRRNAANTRWYAAIYRVGEPFFTAYEDLKTYRPHLNNEDVWGISGDALYDANGQQVEPLPDLAAAGYAGWRRFDLNDLRQLVLEVDPLPDLEPAFTGERDVVLWDGQNLQLLYSSPDFWVGRPNLNTNGIVVFEGYGCLPGCQSDPNDTEVFVYRHQTGTVVQLTDDDEIDLRPKVTEDGLIVWFGMGGYPGSTSGEGDWEIFFAAGDPDGDSIGDPNDNCDYLANVDQTDLGGNEVGDACDCGDQTGDGRVDARDVTGMQLCLAGLQACASLCDADQDLVCASADPAAVERFLSGAGRLRCAENPGSF
jgi:hypothetical protein